MRKQPFEILRPFTQNLSVSFFEKEDAPLSDDIVREHLHAQGLTALHQVHGSRAICVRKPTSRIIQADALATDVPGLALTLRIADCQSFIVYAPSHHVVGLIHAGWRGLVAGVIPSFFRLLKEEWQIRPEETIVCSAPSLCLACSRFTDPSTELPTIRPDYFSNNHVDLRAIAKDQLFTLGVMPRSFERMSECTCCDPQAYWSYRGGDRDAVQKGMTNMLACVLSPLV